MNLDMHIHTTFGSGDSSLTPKQLITESKKNNIQGFLLSEHSGGWDNHSINSMFSKTDLFAIPGIEVNTTMGHIIVIGLSSHIDGISNIRTLRKILNQKGGLMISAHPCRRLFDNPINNSNLLWPDGHNKELTPEIAAEHPLFSIVDEIETQNGSNSTKENEFASKIAESIGVVGIGGSDAHSTEGIGSCYTKFEKSITSSEELIEAIKSKSFTAISK